MDWNLIKQVMMPEFFVLLGIVSALFLSVSSKSKYTWFISSLFLALGVIQLAAVQLPAVLEHTIEGPGSVNVLYGSFVFDTLSVYFRILIYTITFFVCLASSKYLKSVESSSEYYAILLTAALGGSFLTASNDFLVFFVALETMGLSAILLASYARKKSESNEAGFKYLLASASASAMILLGISFIYGLTGSTHFHEVSMKFIGLNSLGYISEAVQVFIAVLIVSGLAFKFAAVPFHNWSPDVYTGSPTTTTLFLSVVSKTAAFGLAIRLFATVLHSGLIATLLAVIAIASIVVGNFVGVTQILNRASAKRLLAYSSIAQAGYLIIGLAILQKESLAALVLYLTIYAVMNTGAFLGVIFFEQESGGDNIYDFAGLIKKKPFAVITTSICLINLAGLPFIPAGFIGKFFLFSAAYSSAVPFGKTLAIIGLLGSVVALYYYLYFIKIMVVDSPSTAVKNLPESKEDNSNFFTIMENKAAITALAASVVLLTYFGIFKIDMLQKMASVVISGIGA